jgi:hypothetical protein
MKKNIICKILIINSVLIGSMLFASCKKEEGTVFTATTENYNSSKDYLGGSNGRIIFWNDGDRVNINGNSYAITLDASDRNRATIHAEDIVSSPVYYGAYPANIVTSNIGGGYFV